MGRPGADTALVPLAERLRYLHVFRATVVTVALACWVCVPSSRGLPLPSLGVLTLTYLLLAACTGGVWRLERNLAIRLFGIVLLVDAVFLALISYGTGGMDSPLRYLILLHLITVSLLASFRTGVKLALWHSLLYCVDYQLQIAGYLQPPNAVGGATVETVQVAMFVTVFWLVTLATASFAAVNERELRRRGYDLESLARLSWQLESTSDVPRLAQALVAMVVDDFGLERVVLAAAGSNHSGLLAGHGVQAPAEAPDPGADRVVRTALEGRSTLLVASSDPAEDPWLAAVMPAARNLGVVPLHAEGQPLGVLVFEHGLRRGSRIERRVVDMVERFGSQAALALANAWLLQQIRELATTDGLTGLFNRRVFNEALAQTLGQAGTDGQLSLILLDIDHFKKVNDTHGHPMGDEVLRLVAAALRTVCRSQDTLARYGGEEFAVLLPGTDTAEAMRHAERCRQQVAGMPGPVPVTISLGVATYPGHAESGGALVSAADTALYQAKRTGRNRTQCFSRGLSALGTPADGGKDSGPRHRPTGEDGIRPFAVPVSGAAEPTP